MRNLYEVVYVGAPHGEDEYGETISRHKTYEAAEKARNKLQDQARYYGSNTVIKCSGLVYKPERNDG